MTSGHSVEEKSVEQNSIDPSQGIFSRNEIIFFLFLVKN